MSETRIDRIKRMETILDEANRALNDCEKAPEKLIGMQKKIRQLYYMILLMKHLLRKELFHIVYMK